MRVLTWIVLLPLMELAVLVILVLGRVGGAATWVWFGATFLVGFVLSRPSPRAAARPGAWWRRTAGYCLMFPGPLSDLLAVLLLAPASRAWLLGALRREISSATWLAWGRPSRQPAANPFGGRRGGDRVEPASPRSRRPASAVRDAEFEILGDGDGPPR